MIGTRFTVNYPSVHHLPVVGKVDVRGIVTCLQNPTMVIMRLVLPIRVSTTPTIGALLHASTCRGTNARSVLLLVRPFNGIRLRLVVPRFKDMREGHLFDRTTFQRLPCPGILRVLLPQAPMALMRQHADHCARERAGAVRLRCVLVHLRCPIRVVGNRTMLCLVIRVRCARFAIRPIPTSVICTRVRRRSAVFSSQGESTCHIGFPGGRVGAFLHRFVRVFKYDRGCLFFFVFAWQIRALSSGGPDSLGASLSSAGLATIELLSSPYFSDAFSEDGFDISAFLSLVW